MESRTQYQFPFSRYPAVRISLFLIAGILLFYLYTPSLLATVATFFILIGFLGVVEWQNKKIISTLLPRLSGVLFLLIIVAFGALRFGIKAEKEESFTIQLIEVSSWEEVKITGIVQSISKTTAGKIRWDLEVVKTSFDHIESDERYKARILADELNEQPTLGDQVTILGTIIPISEKRNPEGADNQFFQHHTQSPTLLHGQGDVRTSGCRFLHQCSQRSYQLPR